MLPIPMKMVNHAMGNTQGHENMLLPSSLHELFNEI
jgi:hypothetical protein